LALCTSLFQICNDEYILFSIGLGLVFLGLYSLIRIWSNRHHLRHDGGCLSFFYTTLFVLLPVWYQSFSGDLMEGCWAFKTCCGFVNRTTSSPLWGFQLWFRWYSLFYGDCFIWFAAIYSIPCCWWAGCCSGFLVLCSAILVSLGRKSHLCLLYFCRERLALDYVRVGGRFIRRLLPQ
jgi:hypothetical protein